MKSFDIFISYKHGKTSAFARKLELSLKTYALPIWTRPRRVFRDENYIVANNDLPKLLQESLTQSEFLILLASEDAAKSKWVKDELRQWCDELGRSDKLIIVLTQGTLEFADGRIDWGKTNSLPAEMLSPSLDSIPFFWDARELTEQQLDLRVPEFKREVNRIVARINGIEPNEMLGEEVKQHKRSILIRNFAIALLLSLSAIAATFGYLAVQSAEQERVQRLAAEDRFGIAMDAIERLHTGFTQSALLEYEGTEELRRQINSEATALYLDLDSTITEERNSISLKNIRQVCRALMSIADLAGPLKDDELAITACLRIQEILQTLKEPHLDEEHELVLRSANVLLSTYGRRGDCEATDLQRERALTVLASVSNSDRYTSLGLAREFGRAMINLIGISAKCNQDLPDHLASHHQQLEMLRSLRDQYADDLIVNRNLAIFLANHGFTHMDADYLNKSQQAAEHALKLARNDRDVISTLALVHMARAEFRSQTLQHSDADPRTDNDFNQAIQYRRDIANRYRGVSEYADALADALMRYSEYLINTARYEDSFAPLTETRMIYERLTALNPTWRERAFATNAYYVGILARTVGDNDVRQSVLKAVLQAPLPFQEAVAETAQLIRQTPGTLPETKDWLAEFVSALSISNN